MTNKELEKKVKELEEKIEGMIDLMLNMAQSIPVKKIDPIELKQVDLPPEVYQGLPFPSKWRQKINEILGENFEAEVEESAGGDYILKVYMPSSLDRRVGMEKNSGRDISVGIVRRGSDVADVEKWSKLICANLQKTFPNFKVL